jgi:hypothetical protein
VAGPVLWLITKNKRWMILTAIGALLFVVDVFYIASQMM